LRPLPCSTRIIIQRLSMYAILRLTTSETRRPAAYAVQLHAGLHVPSRREKPCDLVGAQHRGQLARLPRTWDPLGHIRFALEDQEQEQDSANAKPPATPQRYRWRGARWRLIAFAASGRNTCCEAKSVARSKVKTV